MANRVKVEIQVNRCKYCGGEFITVENYGQCRKGCPGNCVELWSQKCDLPKSVEEKILQHTTGQAQNA